MKYLRNQILFTNGKEEFTIKNREFIYKYYAYIKNKEQWKEETIEEGIID